MTGAGPSILTLALGNHSFIGQTLEQVAQKGGGCPTPGNSQGHFGWGTEQPNLIEDIAQLRVVGLGGF